MRFTVSGRQNIHARLQLFEEVSGAGIHNFQKRCRMESDPKNKDGQKRQCGGLSKVQVRQMWFFAMMYMTVRIGPNHLLNQPKHIRCRQYCANNREPAHDFILGKRTH